LKNPDIIEPAKIKAAKIDKANTIIKIEKISGIYSKIYIYAVPKVGEETKLKTYSAGWEIPLYKGIGGLDLSQYEAFMFYINDDKGGESLF